MYIPTRHSVSMTFDVISEQVKKLVTKTLNDLDKSWPSIKYEVLNFTVDETMLGKPTMFKK